MSEYRTFKLHAEDIKLLDAVQLVCDRHMWLWPREIAEHLKVPKPFCSVAAVDAFDAVWRAIARHHGFAVQTVAPHPDGKPQILAKLTRLTRNGDPLNDDDNMGVSLEGDQGWVK